LVGDQFAATPFQFPPSIAYCPVNSARSIVLIGFMGAGKSSVGRLLEKRTGLARFETDERIASRSGLTIPEIFSQHGEERFRELETEVLQSLPNEKEAIIVTGGGIVLRETNLDLMRQLGTIVWLDGNEEILFQRASRKGNRPLLQTENPRNKFTELLRTRVPLYAKIAEVRIDTSTLTHDEVADIILDRIDDLTSTKQ
jgi:shikimate kinase